MSKLSIFEHFLSVGNLKPKLEWFFKPKLKPKMFLLNFAPALALAASASGAGRRLFDDAKHNQRVFDPLRQTDRKRDIHSADFLSASLWNLRS